MKLTKENAEQIMIGMGFIKTKDNNQDKIEFLKAWKLLEKIQRNENIRKNEDIENQYQTLSNNFVTSSFEE